MHKVLSTHTKRIPKTLRLAIHIVLLLTNSGTVLKTSNASLQRFEPGFPDVHCTIGINDAHKILNGQPCCVKPPIAVSMNFPIPCIYRAITSCTEDVSVRDVTLFVEDG